MNQGRVKFLSAIITELLSISARTRSSIFSPDRYDRNRIPSRNRMRVLVIKLVQELDESFPIKPCDGYVTDTQNRQKVQNPAKANPVPKQQ